MVVRDDPNDGVIDGVRVEDLVPLTEDDTLPVTVTLTDTLALPVVVSLAVELSEGNDVPDIVPVGVTEAEGVVVFDVVPERECVRVELTLAEPVIV